MIYLYDTHNAGILQFHYKDAGGQWVDYHTSYLTSAFRTWCPVPHQGSVDATALRITKMDANSRFAEVGLCDALAGSGRTGERSHDLEKLSGDMPTSPSIKIFPNPASEEIHVVFPPGKYQKLALSDLNGKLISTTNISMEEGERRLDVSALPEGVYMLRLENEIGVCSHAKVVKMN